ncbi:uncharacterized protein LOC130054258 [Ostrea edulis]|uniref:uncharacterized protein LOC130054258 n=1 Tax=Ostrea edulis TaxID=37623 RepID=UPI0024AECBFA|nr:uncharacterized protein LOC130054258 [Ostrea edulis]XP_056019409.1 uncharacterized protein LOC130054258 [Ostrea edulis]XP_056019410.1 uncharacterized protein LOC130054258 [Ostrea edulis]
MMERIDFLHGVVLLAVILLSPFVLSLYGYLDEPTYVPISRANSFYGESTEPIRHFRQYRLFLNAVYFVLYSIVACLALEPIFRRVSRRQTLYYRPYYIYHSMVCLIPVVIRYVNMNAGISDDIMLQIQWENLFFTISSVFRFIFSFCMAIFQRYKKWRLLLYLLITAFLAFLFSYVFCVLCSTVVELISVIRKSKGEFLTSWSYFDYEQVPDELNVSKVNTIHRYYTLDQDQFLKTWEEKLQSPDKHGTLFPYHRKVYVNSIGESVRLSCSAVVSNCDSSSIKVVWKFNEQHSVSNQSKIKTEFEKMRNGLEYVSSNLTIDAIKNSDFGNYSCFFCDYSKAVTLAHFHRYASEYLIGQYSVQKNNGNTFYIYATPGSAVHLTWKPMLFYSESSDLVQYYYINDGLYSKQDNGTKWRCSALSYLYILYGIAMEWFFLPELTPSSSDFFVNTFGSYQSFFIECAGPSVFGVHSIEYFRRMYDEKTKSFVLIEVKHPNTLIVLPDLPYFLKMDNVTKTKKKLMIQKLQQSDLEYTWFENTHICVLVARVFVELVFVILIILILIFCVCKVWKLYLLAVQQPIRNVCLGRLAWKTSDPCMELGCNKSYTCYILCSNDDRESVYSSLVLPLRTGNITTGFNFEECDINRSGKSEFDIHCDILKQCDHLIFFITSAYLEEEAFVGIQLDTVLKCIQMKIMPANCVLIIRADSSVVDKLRYNLPEAVIHDWITITDAKTRLRQILEWIKKDKAEKQSAIAISTAFFG